MAGAAGDFGSYAAGEEGELFRMEEIPGCFWLMFLFLLTFRQEDCFGKIELNYHVNYPLNGGPM